MKPTCQVCGEMGMVLGDLVLVIAGPTDFEDETLKDVWLCWDHALSHDEPGIKFVPKFGLYDYRHGRLNP